jgi:uncharacterized protein YecT (DUF1311 family)
MKHLKLLWVLLLMLSSNRGFGQDECSFGSEEAADSLEHVLAAAPTCTKAADELSKCRWGSSADVRFASIVLEKCEKALLPKLTAAGKRRYQRERELCAYEYSGQEGTLYLSEAAMCGVFIAQRFEEKPSLAEVPAPRASFDCHKASTSLEKAICSDEKLGQADIVLARAYQPLLQALPPSKRSVLIRQQKEWRHRVERQCGVGLDPLPPRTRECVRKQFESRFTDLDGCSVGGPEECLRQRRDDAL